MGTSVILMPFSNDAFNLVGDPVHADGWYGFSDGLHTISIHVVNFSGRIGIQASLALEPTEDDWFDIQLSETTPYIQFPMHPSQPTGFLQGDTTNFALTFKANILWCRAVMDRTYIPVVFPYNGELGVVNKIVLSS